MLVLCRSFLCMLVYLRMHSDSCLLPCLPSQSHVDGLGAGDLMRGNRSTIPAHLSQHAAQYQRQRTNSTSQGSLMASQSLFTPSSTAAHTYLAPKLHTLLTPLPFSHPRNPLHGPC